MDTSMAREPGRSYGWTTWDVIGDCKDCGLRVNKIGLNSYFDEADMNS